MICNKSPCQILRLGSKNQFQETVKGRSYTSSSYEKGFRFAKSSLRQKPKYKFFPGNVVKGAKERRWWGVKKEEKRSQYRTMRVAMSTGNCSDNPRRPMALLSERCLAPTKGGRKRRAALHCPHTTGQKFFARLSTLPMCEWQVGFQGGATHNVTQRPKGRKQGVQIVPLRWVMVNCTWENWLVPRTTGHSWNKG